MQVGGRRLALESDVHSPGPHGGLGSDSAELLSVGTNCLSQAAIEPKLQVHPQQGDCY